VHLPSRKPPPQNPESNQSGQFPTKTDNRQMATAPEVTLKSPDQLRLINAQSKMSNQVNFELVTTLADLDSLDSDLVAEGYATARPGDPEPGSTADAPTGTAGAAG